MNIYRVKTGSPVFNTYLVSARSVEEAAKKGGAKARKISGGREAVVSSVELIGELD